MEQEAQKEDEEIPIVNIEPEAEDQLQKVKGKRCLRKLLCCDYFNFFFFLVPFMLSVLEQQPETEEQLQKVKWKCRLWK